MAATLNEGTVWRFGTAWRAAGSGQRHFSTNHTDKVEGRDAAGCSTCGDMRKDAMRVEVLAAEAFPLRPRMAVRCRLEYLGRKELEGATCRHRSTGHALLAVLLECGLKFRGPM